MAIQTLSEGKNIKGYFYKAFPQTTDYTYLANSITSYNKNKNEISIIPSSYNVTIEYSNAKTYEEYIEEVKNELKKSNYHFFLIDYKTLFGDFTHYNHDFNQKLNDALYENTKSSNTSLNNNKPFKINKDYFYTKTIPLSKHFNYMNDPSINGFFSDNILYDCRLNEEYYAYPFSSSYNFLFYNIKMLREIIPTEEFNNLSNDNGEESQGLTWERLKEIINEFKKRHSDKYGINMTLNSKEEFTSFFLEYLYSTHDIYNSCHPSIFKNINSKKGMLKDRKYYVYNECDKSDILNDEEKIKGIFIEIDNLLKNNIINEKSLINSEEEAYLSFINGESLFFRGGIEYYKKIYDKNRESLNFDINSKNDDIYFTNNENGTTELLTIANYTIYEKKMNYGFGVTLLPKNYSTYKSYVLIGNNHKDFKADYTDISKTLSSIIKDNYLIKRASTLSILPPYDYSVYGINSNEPINYQDNALCKKDVPCYTHLQYIKPISLTNTLFNKESLSNDQIMAVYYKSFQEYYNETINKDLLLNNKAMNNEMVKQSHPYICILYIIGMSSLFDFSILEPGIPTRFECILNHHLFYTLLYTAIATIIIINIGFNILWDIMSPRNTFIKYENKDTLERIPQCDNYYDEYQYCMYAMGISSIFIVFAFFIFKIRNGYLESLFIRRTLTFLIGITVLSFTVLPKIIEVITGKQFKQSYRKSKNLDDNNISSMIHGGNFNVISFNNDEPISNDESLFNTRIVSPYHPFTIDRISKNNDNNNDIQFKPYYNKYNKYINMDNRYSSHF
ncbi:hypothetical protein PIROE2DRAFT_4908 [Piromyces sp. E2]|nr:hypothetical protein PIROE2DRAFT_4908 [Piromyces sp. E2]|eukprot:OUM67619.1 hypothetical protein PIROE2DRAFT_4908 [Piromyces sp. E2]